MSLRLLAILARLGLGLLLFYATLSFVVALLSRPEVQQSLSAFGLLLIVLWFLWSRCRTGSGKPFALSGSAGRGDED